MKNTHLQNAKARKDDEFYTRFEGKENKLIEPYSVKNYFVRVLINYDPIKIKFYKKILTKNESSLK